MSLALLLADISGAAPIIDEHFEGRKTLMPDGSRKLYPDKDVWAFTFYPGIRWPEAFGDGVNWLEANGECEVYLTPFSSRGRSQEVPINLRFDPFSIDAEGLHIRAGALTRDQMSAYGLASYRRFGSGMILSRRTFTYGKIRVVAKLPAARGSWPAIWLLAPGRWPPELDALEAMAWGSHRNQIHIGLIPTHEDVATTSVSDWLNVHADLAQGFHEYGVDWTAKTITFYFDGQALTAAPTPGSMHQPMYVLLNLAVGGKWPYNEVGVDPVDDSSAQRLNAGSDLVEPDYPAELVVKSISVRPIS